MGLFEMAESAYLRGETVRFSGGDPVMFPHVTLAVSQYMQLKYGAKVSIAHNGTGSAGSWISDIAPCLSSAAIDLKAAPEKMGKIMGISQSQGERFYGLSLKSQRILSNANVLMDVRTPIFGNTKLGEMLILAENIAANTYTSNTFWTWRLYKPVEGCDWLVPDKNGVFDMMATVSGFYPKQWIGVRAKWEKGGMVYFRNGNIINQSDITSHEQDYELVGSGNRI
jgi:hypothetical protein